MIEASCLHERLQSILPVLVPCRYYGLLIVRLKAQSRQFVANCLLCLIGSGGWIRTIDLRVMSPTSCHCSTPRQEPHRCIDLVSQGVIPPVPLALRCFTTRFEMGRGGASALKTHLGGDGCRSHHLHLFALTLCSFSGWFAMPVSSAPLTTAQSSLTRQALGPQLASALPLTRPPRRSCSTGSSCRDLTSLKAARRLVLQWASHLDAFSGSPSRP